MLLVITTSHLPPRRLLVALSLLRLIEGTNSIFCVSVLFNSIFIKTRVQADQSSPCDHISTSDHVGGFPGEVSGLTSMSSCLSRLEQTILQAKAGLNHVEANGSVWLDECIRAVQSASICYHSAVHADPDQGKHAGHGHHHPHPHPHRHDKHMDYHHRYYHHGKLFAQHLVSLLRLSGSLSLQSRDGCNMCGTILSTVASICKANDIQPPVPPSTPFSPMPLLFLDALRYGLFRHL